MRKLFLVLLISMSFFLGLSYLKADEENIEEREDKQSLVEDVTAEDQSETPDEEKAPIIENNESSEQVLLENENLVNQVAADESGSTTQFESTPQENEDDITLKATDNGDSVPAQMAKIIITKVDEKGELLKGAKLQILDENENVIVEWTSGEEAFETMLPNGNYILREKQAPDGYEKAEDKTFTVEIIYHANTNYPDIPCEAATTYYVEIDGVPYEVYCINQYLSEPVPNADYDGKLLTADEVRNYTQQITLKDPYTNNDSNYNELREQYPHYIVSHHGHLTDGPIDVSDQSLSNEELYNVILDIVYRRNLASEQERFSNIPPEAISFLTEMALKTYTNAGITQIQGYRSLPDGDFMYEYSSGYYWCLMHMYKDYVYDPSSPNGWRIDRGNGDALGNFARHWTINQELHETRNLSVDHPEYAEFFYYLLGDETSADLVHTDDMSISIYRSISTDKLYQNLLGITGYLAPVVKLEMVNKYSNKTRNISVEKVWDDKDDYNKKRPTSVTVTLFADGDEYETVELNEENNWKHTFENLPCYDEGRKIEYTIDENKVEGYETEILGNADKGFKIINFISGTGGNDNPNTADNIFTYIAMMIISFVGIISFSYKIVKNN